MLNTSVLEINCDGGSRGNPGPAAAAFVVVKNGKEIASASQFLGVTTNNVAEYTALLMALKWVIQNRDDGNENIVFRLDSELVVKQILGDYKVKSEHLIPLYKETKMLIARIKTKVSLLSVPRSKNSIADALVNNELDNHQK